MPSLDSAASSDASMETNCVSWGHECESHDFPESAKYVHNAALSGALSGSVAPYTNQFDTTLHFEETSNDEDCVVARQ